MPARSLLDSNVLVYTDDADSRRKQARALELYAEVRGAGTGVVSTQVLDEYFVAATRKLGVPAATARRKVELFARLHVVVIDSGDILAAIDLHRLHQFSFWDALVIRAAQRAGCSVLYSEDMQDGRSIDGVTVRNPF